MVEDTPDDLVHEIFSEHFWEGHPLGRPILGRPRASVADGRTCCARYFNEHLRGAQPDRRGGRQHRARAGARAGRARRSRRCPASGTPHVRAVRRTVVPRVIVRNKELEQSHVCLGTERLPAGPRRPLSRATSLNTVLGGSMSSRLFQNVREKRGLAYAVFSGLSAYRDAGADHDLRRLRQRSRGRADRRRGARTGGA